jgi:hypothetical protein
MAKITIPNIVAGYASVGALNNSFQAVEDALNSQVLYRDNPVGEPNQMKTALDMDGQPILNIGWANSINSAVSLGQLLEYANSEESLSGVIPITWEFLSTGESTYTLPLASVNKVDMYIVSVDGVILPPSQYTISVDEQKIVFTSAPTFGAAIVVRLFGKIPDATPDSLTINNVRGSSLQTVVGSELTFNTPFNTESDSTDVYLNGVKLVNTVDYSVGATSITLASAATAGDIIEIVSHSVILAASANLSAMQDIANAAAEAAANAAQSALDAASAGAAAGAIAGGVGTVWSTKTANYTATHLDGIFADTSGGSFNITLPAAPSVGMQVYFVDVSSSFNTHPLTIIRNGEYIMGTDEDMVVNTQNTSFRLVYSGSSYGWRLA